MNVLYLAPSQIPSRAANAVHVVKMCSAFCQSGLHVTLSAARGLPQVQAKDVLRIYDGNPELDIVWRRSFGKGAVGKILGWIVILLRHGITSDYVYSRSLLGALLARILGRPTFLEIHEDIIGSSWIKKISVKAISSQSGGNRIVVISQALKRHMVDRYGIEPFKIKISPDGADLVVKNGGLNSPKLIRCSPLSVGYVGSLLPGKGVDLVVDLARRLPSLRFTIVGGTCQEVLQAVGGTTLPENLSCMGYVDNTKVRNLIEGMDVCLLPNSRKVKGVGGTEIGAWTSPLKLFEYMAVGKPVIASNLPVLREILDHKRNAWLCNPEDPEEWVAALLFFDQNFELARNLGDNARDEFEKSYTWAARAESIIENCFR